MGSSCWRGEGEEREERKREELSEGTGEKMSHEHLQKNRPMLRKKHSSWKAVERKTKEKEALRHKKIEWTKQREVMLMYWQSVFVWNLKFHFLAYTLFVYLTVFYGADLLAMLNAFQILGLTLCLVVLIPTILMKKKKADALEEKEIAKNDKGKEEASEVMEQNSRIFWPDDATTFSADTFPLGMGSFTGKVKLYNLDQSLEVLKSFQRSFKKANTAVRILRYSNPTQFLFTMCFICGMGAIVGNYFAGKTIALTLSMVAMFLPGLIRRKIFIKIRRKLETHKLRKLINFLLVTENPNLEETNTQKVMAFVTNVDQKKAPKVVTKAA